MGGKLVYEKGRFLNVDRDTVPGEIAEALGRPRTETEETSRVLRRQVFPHVQAFYEGCLKDMPARDPFYAPSSRT